MSSVGVLVLGAGVLLFIFSLLRDMRSGKEAGDDPWDGRTLEWSISSPPPHYDFGDLPIVRDRDPLWHAKHPELIEKRDELSESTDDEPTFQNAADDEDEFVHIPGQSWFPFLASVGLFVGGMAAVYHNWLLGSLSFAFILLCVFAWAFEGVGGHYVRLRPSERRGTGLAYVKPKKSLGGQS